MAGFRSGCCRVKGRRRSISLNTPRLSGRDPNRLRARRRRLLALGAFTAVSVVVAVLATTGFGDLASAGGGVHPGAGRQGRRVRVDSGPARVDVWIARRGRPIPVPTSFLGL